MSDIKIENVDQNQFGDMFGDMTGPSKLGSSFSGAGIGDADIFSPQADPSKPVNKTDPDPDPKTDPNSEPDPKKDPVTNEDPEANPDILGTGIEPQKQTTTSSISDLESYYKDRIQSGKFVKIEDTDETGKAIEFIPKTAEEYDEVLELQIQHRVNSAKKDLEKSWYESKSPAWKTISRYAEMVDDPTQLIPFLQGVRTIQSVANMDENDLEGAEQIVRTRLVQRGDSEEVISQQIEALKTTDKLISTAKVFKPAILQQEQAELQSQMNQRHEEEKEYLKLVSSIREEAIKSIESPIFGKTNLKREEKAMIYDLIAEPSEDTQGYAIYNEIDQLFEKKNFDTLKEIALLLTNREAFMNYLGAKIANATAASLEKKLRVAGESHSQSSNDNDVVENTPKISRTQYKPSTRFGR